MTCKEKLRLDHPEWDDFKFGLTIGSKCPADFGYPEDPDTYCDCSEEGCVHCWDQPYNGNIPETPTEEKTVNEQRAEAGLNLITETASIKPGILDSGDRTEFATGAVRDMREGKGRMDLLPWSAIMEISKHCENGAKKYGEHNVDKGIPTSSLCDSAARHLAKYLEGWTDEAHLVAAAWNLLWAIQMEIKNPDVVNTPYRGQPCSERKYDK